MKVDRQILEFVGLRSKLYSYVTENSVEKKCKGIKKCIVKNQVTFEEYKDCLKSGKEIFKTQNKFTNLKRSYSRFCASVLRITKGDY
jgi:hypothetical protein